MRGKQAKKRKLSGDYKYNSLLIARLINSIMKDGKKRLAENIVYKSLDMLEPEAKKAKKKSIELLEDAINSVKPSLEVKSRRVGGVNYQVPTAVPEGRQVALATKWLIEGAKTRRKKEEFYKAFAYEILDTLKGMGLARKKKEDMEKMAEANKAFAHFQW